MEGLVYEINLAAARLARQAADAVAAKGHRPTWVAGALGPTTRTASMSRDVADPGARQVTFHDLVAAYYEQARGLLDGGVDLLLPETAYDTPATRGGLSTPSGPGGIAPLRAASSPRAGARGAAPRRSGAHHAEEGRLRRRDNCGRHGGTVRSTVERAPRRHRYPRRCGSRPRASRRLAAVGPLTGVAVRSGRSGRVG
jgi:hypothetical protein